MHPLGRLFAGSAGAQGGAADGERNQILATLERCRGNKTKAAAELGISRRTILRKMKEWGLE